MKTLASYYRKNGFDYALKHRTAMVAMFKQTKDDRTVGYEVGWVKSDKGGTFGGVTIEPGERFWTNEDFGSVAWSFVDYGDALARYNELCEQQSAA